VANVPVDAMSIRHGDNAHAARWLTRHGFLEPGSSHDVFLPRETYGIYLAQHASALVRDLRRRGWQIEFVDQRATGVAPAGSHGYVLECAGRRDEFDYVILCAGGSVHGNPLSLDRCDEYIPDPYPTSERLRGIPSDAAVGVLGSGLTAVDVAVALKERGHAGPIRMYSRSGTLPLVRRPGPRWTPKHLTPDRVTSLSCSGGSVGMADVERLFNREVRAWGGEPRGVFPHVPRLGARAWLRWQLDHPHDATDLGTFIFQKSVPLVWQDIWYSLNADDQLRILASSSAMRSIMSRCCPMPRPNAEKVLAMLESGQLEVRGGLMSVARGRDAFDVQLTAAREQTDYIVNAVTPPVYGVHSAAEQLVSSAVAHRLARRHHAGGLEIVPGSSAVVGSRGPGGLYALGDLTRGAFFFTFGLPALVRRGADIARAIHDDMHEQTLRRRSRVPIAL
jgi:uncharacterized NAD(P)/FAD-binding protein YdhS